MTQQFEDFVNAALDKSLASDVTLPTANKIPVYTGIGRQVTGKTPAELGLAVLVDGVVPANQLPSYVDDVLEFANLASFPVTGESGKVYVAIDTNKTYRWSGSTYVQIGSDLALGETPSTAYRGDRGKTAYDHSQATGNPHGATTADINDSANKRYITDAQQTVLSNTSGSNSGDETQASIKTKLGAASSGVDGYLTGSDWNTFNGKQAALADVVTANTYGNSTQWPIVTVNAKGIVTGITEVDVPAGVTVLYSDSLTSPLAPNTSYLILAVNNFTLDASLLTYGHSVEIRHCSNSGVTPVTVTLTSVAAAGKLYKDERGTNITTIEVYPASNMFMYKISTDVYSVCHRAGVYFEQNFKLKKTNALNTDLSLSLSAMTEDRVWTVPDKAINFGDLPSVATTNSNSTSTGARLLKGDNCTLVNNSPCVVNGSRIASNFVTGGAGYARGGAAGSASKHLRPAYVNVPLAVFTTTGATSGAWAIDGGTTYPMAVAPQENAGTYYLAIHRVTFSIIIGVTLDAYEWVGVRRIVCRRDPISGGLSIVSVTTEGTDYVHPSISGQSISVTLGAVVTPSAATTHAPLLITATSTTSGASSILCQATLESYYANIG